jgi:hypothetical protein
VASDTHVSLRVRDGRRLRTAVAHLVGPYDCQLGESEITIRGALGWAKHKQMTPFNLVALRFLMLSVGRFFPDLIRKLLQRVLITGKTPAPFEFTRRLIREGTALRVVDEIRGPSWRDVVAAGCGASQTSIYVVMSRTYQDGQLQLWRDLTPQVRHLADGQPLRLERVL